jgi:hypothetical protein
LCDCQQANYRYSQEKVYRDLGTKEMWNRDAGGTHHNYQRCKNWQLSGSS